MQIIHLSDLTALNDLLNAVILTGLFISLFLFAFIKDIFDYFSRNFQRPQRIKVEDGFLYRTKSGVYASKDRCFDLDQEFKRKQKARWIAHHERVIARLKKDD